jgi:hypothetical protein
VNLRIVNTDPAGSPLSLVAEPGNPPLKVNRSAKVANLNADKLDGLSAHALVRVAHASTNDVDESIFGGGNAADVLTVTVKAPRSGFLVVNATIDGFGSVFDGYQCSLEVDDALVPGTLLAAAVGSSNREENCSTTGVHAVAAGTHTVDLRIAGRTSAGLSRASLWAMYVPFDGQGKRS